MSPPHKFLVSASLGRSRLGIETVSRFHRLPRSSLHSTPWPRGRVGLLFPPSYTSVSVFVISVLSTSPQILSSSILLLIFSFSFLLWWFLSLSHGIPCGKLLILLFEATSTSYPQLSSIQISFRAFLATVCESLISFCFIRYFLIRTLILDVFVRYLLLITVWLLTNLFSQITSSYAPIISLLVLNFRFVLPFSRFQLGFCFWNIHSFLEVLCCSLNFSFQAQFDDNQFIDLSL